MTDQLITINGEQYATSDLTPETLAFVKRSAQLQEVLISLQMQVSEHQVLIAQYNAAVIESLEPVTEED